MTTALHDLTAVELADAYRTGRLSPVEATRAALDRISACEPKLNAEVRAHRPARWGELNTRLHLAFYRHAGQPRTLAIVTNLLQQCDRLTRVHLSLSRGFKRAEDEHAELLSLCRDGLIERASSRLLAHIAHVRDDLIDFLATKTRR